jgi:hypothetical protein
MSNNGTLFVPLSIAIPDPRFMNVIPIAAFIDRVALETVAPRQKNHGHRR